MFINKFKANVEELNAIVAMIGINKSISILAERINHEPVSENGMVSSDALIITNAERKSRVNAHEADTAELREELCVSKQRIEELEEAVSQSQEPVAFQEPLAVEGYDAHYNVYMPHLDLYNRECQGALATHVMNDILQFIRNDDWNVAQALYGRFKSLFSSHSCSYRINLELLGEYYDPDGNDMNDIDFDVWTAYINKLEAVSDIIPNVKDQFRRQNSLYRKYIEAKSLGFNPSDSQDVKIGKYIVNKEGNATYKDIASTFHLSETETKKAVQFRVDMFTVKIDKNSKPYKIVPLTEAEKHVARDTCRVDIIQHIQNSDNQCYQCPPMSTLGNDNHKIGELGYINNYVIETCSQMIEDGTLYTDGYFLYVNSPDGLAPKLTELENELSEILEESEDENCSEWARQDLAEDAERTQHEINALKQHIETLKEKELGGA